MAKVELKPGDYVLTEGMDEETYHKVARAFIEAGSAEGEYPNVSFMESNMEGWGFGWGVRGGMYHGLPGSYLTGRQLTVAQVLGEEYQAMPDVGSRWLDEDGQLCEVMHAYEQWLTCRHVELALSKPFVARAGQLKPLKPERDKAVEEMQRVVRQATGAGCSDAMATALYDAGYRKVEL